MTAALPNTSVTIATAAISVEILAAGASVRSIRLPGVSHSLVLGAADTAVYGPANRHFLGASVGRNANRIAGARFRLDGEEHRLSVNEPPHHLHGGLTGFWAQDWALVARDDRRAVFALTSPDGADGYPGEARVTATFVVGDDATLAIDYEGTVDRRSLLNLTSHLYFNLSGKASARSHLLQVEAEAYLPVDPTLIPTGEVRSIAGTPFDFKTAKALSAGPDMLDHSFCLDGGKTSLPRPVARLTSETSGLSLILETTECGLQVYDGAGFDGTVPGVSGSPIGPYGGIALEPQGWPDAPNHAAFPSSAIAPGEIYRHSSRYRFVPA